MHVVPPAQALPHMPQFVLLESKSTQAPLHSVNPTPQFPLQRPAEQTSPIMHIVPQVPQFMGSLLKSTHVPLHAICPIGHGSTHCPWLHNQPAWQALPHIPQFDASTPRSAHVPLQSVCPAGQAQAPPTQDFPPRHAAAQAPQFRLSVCVSTQAAPQSVRPPQSVVHAPLLHTSPLAHVLPHMPQFCGSLTRSAQNPLQFDSGAQLPVQTPSEHT
jgi:hypothetical protein